MRPEKKILASPKERRASKKTNPRFFEKISMLSTYNTVWRNCYRVAISQNS